MTLEKMAIVTPFGLSEFVRMQFGLKNAAQTFQRLMDRVTQHLDGVFVYLDDILIASKTPRRTPGSFDCIVSDPEELWTGGPAKEMRLWSRAIEVLWPCSFRTGYSTVQKQGAGSPRL